MSAAALRGVAVGPHRDARAGGEPGLTARSPHSSARLGLRALPFALALFLPMFLARVRNAALNRAVLRQR